MTGAIFLIQGDENLLRLSEQAYDSEDLLQRLLADHPDLLPGDQINSASPRRWLLVKREAGVPSKNGGGSQWAIDNLFLDQEGIPTIVEVKRSSDTRIRREVVGQMLDYAANAVAYWPAASLQTMFVAYWNSKDKDPEVVLSKFLSTVNTPTDESVVPSDPVSPTDTFWQTVEPNLQARRIRMLFVADVIPPELQRIVEFLNEQMNPAEVLAVEIRQYVDETNSAKTLVPRVIGQTAQAQATKDVLIRSLPWDRDRFLAVLSQKTDPDTAEIASQAMDKLVDSGWQLLWGRGTVDGSCQPVFDYKGVRIYPFFPWTYGRVAIQFVHLALTPPFTRAERRQALRKRVLTIPGVQLPDEIDKYPSFPISALKAPGALETLLNTWNWVAEELKSHIDGLEAGQGV